MMRPAKTNKTESSRPALLQAMIDAFKIPDLRGKILFTFGMLIVFRFVAHVPLPGVDQFALDNLFRTNQLLGFLDLFSGGALQNLSVAALGVYPYITSSIVMQILTPVFPKLKALAEEGELGRQKINQITHWITVPIALLQGYGQLILLQRAGVLTGVGFSGDNLIPTLAMITSLIAGTMFLVWLGELITERGLGNGVSLIIFGGIVAGFPQLIGQGFLEGGQNIGGLMLLVLFGVGIIYFIVLFTEGERRIPVQYGRSVFRGGRMYRQTGASHLPIKVNSAGMIPLIFAFSIMILPATIASYFADPLSTSMLARIAGAMENAFSTTGPVYWIAVFFLVIAFAFFYTLITFSQQKLAENLQKNGGFVPGIRPGRPTQEFLNRTILRVTWGGAIFLGIVAIMPYFATTVTDIRALTLSSTSLLIMVGVALDTMRQLEAQLLMRQYEGFIN